MKKNLKNPFDFLKDIVDNTAHNVYVKHVYKSGFFDNRPDSEKEDVCLEMFGEQDEECIKHNDIRQPLNSQLDTNQPNKD